MEAFMKLKLIATTVLAMAALTGCSQKTEVIKPEIPVVTEEAEKEVEKEDEDILIVEVKRSEIELENALLVTEITFENGIPVSVEIDELVDGASKYELAKSGDYVMTNETQSWDKQVDALKEAIEIHEFDLTKIVAAEDSEEVDVVSGVTIDIPNLLLGVEEILSDSTED